MNNPILAEIVRLCDDASYVAQNTEGRRTLPEWNVAISDMDVRLMKILALAHQLDDQLGEKKE